ncbi:MAG: hypothetical protein ACFFE8_01995 [Candidatus Heimdallarchaeota archaeon]
MTTLEPSFESRIPSIEATKLDQFIQILEISFIFLICFTLITLVNSALLEGVLDLYRPIADGFLGERGYGSFDGGNFGVIVQITLVFNVLLFSISLFFGLWIRRSRDGWSWSQLGYTYKTQKYNTISLLRRAIVLGILGIIVFFTILSPVVFVSSGGDLTAMFFFHAYHKQGTLFTPVQLYAEYYFGFIEMGFLWPLSAGFFFFSYVYNSFKARFSTGVANLISTIFYVIYLIFFFMIDGPDKLAQLPRAILDPIFWGMAISFFFILYISFSAFSETGSVVLPFTLNFVFNVGLTIIRATNSLIFASLPTSAHVFMLIPYFLLILIIGLWFLVKRDDFSTIRLGVQDFLTVFKKKSRKNTSLMYLAGITILFFFISFFIPGILEHIVANPIAYPPELFAFINAVIYIVLIVLALVILNYSPTQVYDVLIVKHPEGIPIASKLSFFHSDEALISGYLSAVSSVSKELDSEDTELRSIKRGDREIILEDGVFTRVIALVDRDHPRIRHGIIELQRRFEGTYSETLASWIGDRGVFTQSEGFVDDITKLEIKFDIPQQARWLAVITLLFTPIMIALIGIF